MSLYDDIDVDEKIETRPVETASMGGINLAFLKDQLKAKKASLQNAQKTFTSTSAPPTAPAAPQQTSVPQSTAPSVNRPRFSPYRPPAPVVNLKPRKAVPLPLDTTATFSIVPQALREDKIFLFNEIEIKDEYNPQQPTEVAAFKLKREAQLAKERAAKEVAERLAKQHAEEERKRRAGAAIAPPPTLIEVEVKSAEPPPPVFDPSAQFGRGVTRGLGVAASIMSKMGYKDGKGLGRDEQGMSTALKMEKTGGKAGRIIGADVKRETDIQEAAIERAPTSVGPPPNITDLLKNASKIVLLKNMVSLSDVDDELEGEIREEMTKYGQLNSVVIHKMRTPTPAEDSVRIFLEFTNIAQATKAVVDLNQRFFGGRAIRATFYPLDDFSSNRYET